MTRLTRRSLLYRSLGLVAAGTLARPYIANAAATTAEVWWQQGFVQEEDVALKKVVADYEKASGNKIELQVVPFAPLRQKIVAATQSGIVPDIFPNTPGEIIALHAWDDRLVDVTDVVETQKSEYTETALLSNYCYNQVEKKRSFYGVPTTQGCLPNHIWRPLIEKAGYTLEDIPKTWDAFYDFFKEVQKKLRAQGVRNVYGLGLNVTTNGGDPNNVFNYFVVAYGGVGMVTKDGKLHLDDPKVKEAVIKAMTYPTTAYKEVFVPPSAINWNDADDNNAFHAKTIVMDLDGTISTEVAVLSQGKKEDYDSIVTMGLPLSNDGKPVPSIAGTLSGVIPKGAKNVAAGLSQILDPADGHKRVPEDGAWPRTAANAVGREKGPLVVRRPAPGGLHPAGPARPDRAEFLGLQPGLRPGPERAHLDDRLDGHHPGRDGAAGGGGKGVQAGRGDLREISDRGRLM